MCARVNRSEEEEEEEGENAIFGTAQFCVYRRPFVGVTVGMLM